MRKDIIKVMVRRWVREELKKEYVSELVLKSIDWIKNNKQKVLAIAGTTVAIIAVISFFIYHFAQLNKDVEERIAQIMGQIQSNNYTQALSICDDTINNYGTSPSTKNVWFYKGQILYQLGKYSESVTAYREFIQRRGHKNIMPLAMVGEAQAVESNNDFVKAIELYDQFTKKYSDHFLTPVAFMSLARCYQLVNRADEALKIYERVISRYPNTYWKQQAEQQTTLLRG